LHIADGVPVVAGVFFLLLFLFFPFFLLLRGTIRALDGDSSGVFSECKPKTHAGIVISNLLGTLPSKVPFISIATTQSR